MKKLLTLSYSLFFIPYFLFSQNVGIGTTTPVTKLHVVSSIGNVATFSGASSMYITLAEGASNRGYIGSFAGNPEDVDFGTYGGNTTGKLHLTIQDVPKLSVDASGNIGIGTTNPLSLLHVTNGSVLFDGTTGATPVAGAGTRLMWIPAKAAFRVGKVTGTNWDDASIGVNSVAMGNTTTASGFNATALGSFAVASGDYSTAMGFNALATGYNAVSTGGDTRASGTLSTAMGNNTTASGDYSMATGNTTTSKSYAGFVTGAYNDSANAANQGSSNPLNRIFQIGNGTADNARNNAMTVLQNGNVGINTINPQSLLHVNDGAALFDGTNGATPVSGGGTRLMWIPAKKAFRAGYVLSNQWDDVNIGSNSIAMGYSTTATGNSSTAMGYNTGASGDYSTAMGYFTGASGDVSTAMGTFSSASGYASTAMGGFSSARGDYSTVIGFSNKSKSYGGTVLGVYNDSTNAANPSSINSGNRLFQIGNGTADFARSNAMTVLQNGNVGIGVLAPSQMLEIAGNITVQNGKGLIRNTDGTQSKKLSTTVTVNASFTAGQTQTFAVSWPESFSAGTIEAYVGNVTGGAGGWAEVVMTVTNVTTTGALLYVYNPKTISVSPNFTIKVIGIGPQ